MTSAGTLLARSARGLGASQYQITVCDILQDGTPGPCQTVAVLEDGTFSFHVTQGNAFVAFLVDPSQQFRKAVGVIGIGVGSDGYWEQIDTSQLEGDITLGKIADVPVNGLLICENPIQNIGARLNDLGAIALLARLDDKVRNFENEINGAPDISAGPLNVYAADSIPIPASMPTLPFYQLSGYQIQIKIAGTSGTDVATLRPPGMVHEGGPVYDQASPITGQWGVGGWGFGQRLQECPPGYWVLDVDSVKRAELYFSLAPPTSSGQIDVPIPVMTITLKPSTDIIDTLTVSMFIRNSAGGYDHILGSDMKEIYGLPHVGLMDIRVDGGLTPEQREGWTDVDPEAGPLRPQKEWHTGPVDGALWATFLACSYGSTWGVQYMFSEDEAMPVHGLLPPLSAVPVLVCSVHVAPPSIEL